MRSASRGFTLVELLVVIAIIGVLVALLLPAVQAARATARRTQCANHLKQIGLAALNHENSQGFYPSNGWGMAWVGDPDRGFGKRQPGGWVFSLLPFIEQQSLHDLGKGLAAGPKATAAAKVTMTPIAEFNCPSRREARPYPQPVFDSAYQAQNADPVSVNARSDYAVCSGTIISTSSGPPDPTYVENGTFGWLDPKFMTGVSFQHSETTIAQVTDGTSHTYLIGEKYLSPDSYENGADGGDNLSMYEGYDWDVNRWGNINDVPQMDQLGIGYIHVFGSAHMGGFNMVFCDGSVHHIPYEIDGQLHEDFAHRADNHVIDAITW